MKISIRVDTGRFDQMTDAYIESVIRPAEAAGLNRAAEKIKLELQDATSPRTGLRVRTQKCVCG